MNAIESILVVLDRTDTDEHVCAKAVQWARLLNAQLELFLCDAERELELKRNYDPQAASTGRAAAIASAERYLSTVRDRLPLDPSRVAISAWSDSPLSESICRKVAQSRPDLVLKSPDSEHPERGLYFSDNDWYLASTCPAPVMFVRGRTWSGVPRIGAAVDLSAPEGLRLVREIASLASQLHRHAQAHLEVITCVPDRADAEPDVHSRRLHETLAEVSVTPNSVHVLEGDADELIPRFSSERRYDVLVMGALARRTGVAPMVGSLTSKLIAGLDCDLVLVKVPSE